MWTVLSVDRAASTFTARSDLGDEITMKVRPEYIGRIDAGDRISFAEGDDA